MKLALESFSATRTDYTAREWRKKLDNNFLSKALDCILHGFLIAKLAAYGFKGTVF